MVLRYWAKRCLRSVTPRSLFPFWRERFDPLAMAGAAFLLLLLALAVSLIPAWRARLG
jgi:hypothetical protein